MVTLVPMLAFWCFDVSWATFYSRYNQSIIPIEIHTIYHHNAHIDVSKSGILKVWRINYFPSPALESAILTAIPMAASMLPAEALPVPARS